MNVLRRLMLFGAVLVLVVLGASALGIYEASLRTTGNATATPVPLPVDPTLPPQVFATITPAQPPAPQPTYIYVWDPNNPNQCFNPSDPDLPANAPRCPPRVVPPDPGGPIIVKISPTPKP